MTFLRYSSAVLESLGDETTMEVRKDKFQDADTDNDGWITYDEFLSVSHHGGIIGISEIKSYLSCHRPCEHHNLNYWQIVAKRHRSTYVAVP